MQRTYKSKKETGGGLDPREVLFSLDEKSSAFDAFYIRNIKQTKRELSCMGSTDRSKVATNRVRKRKPLRKIVKEVVEPAIDGSMSKSTYLTPDKSIHVNKGLDLFDQLLKSSLEPLQSPRMDKDNLFDQLRLNMEQNTSRCTKSVKKTRAKKFNYSSSDTSDNEKENMTDLRKHELIIETVTKASPNIRDDSINQIVNNIAINKIIKNKTSRQSFTRSSSKSKNRLTKNLPTNMGDSPLCSTPFVEKYRGKSIYRFSPIAMGTLDDSDKINDEKKNTSLNVEDGFGKCLNDVTNLSENVDDRSSQSPVLTSKSSLFSHSSNTSKRKDIAAERSPNYNKQPSEVKVCLKMDDEQVNGVSTCQNSAENTPFFGFVKTSFNESIKMPKELEDQEKSVLLPSRKSIVLKCNVYRPNKKTPPMTKELSRKIHVSDDMFAGDQSSTEKSETMEASVELEPFLGFTESTIRNKCEEVIKIDESEASNDNSEAEITTVDAMPNIDDNLSGIKENFNNFSPNETGYKDYSTDESNSEDDAHQTSVRDNSSTENSADEASFQNNSASETNSSGTITHESDSANTEYSEDFNSIHNFSDNNVDDAESTSDKQSLYNTCNSIDCENEPPLSEIHYSTYGQPVVVLDRLNDSTLKKYYCNRSDPNSSKDSSSTKSCNESIGDDEENTIKEEIDDLQTSEDLNSEEEVEKQISFVTTRRRQDIKNESLMIILDTSDDSVDSSEGNKTVLSNHNVENTPSKNYLDSKESKISLPMHKKSVTLRRDSMCSVRDSVQAYSKLDVTEAKAPIVLQPGKKWERSLSIYRRMTLQSDLEQSIAEDEDLVKKGRKYRESVIHTMELQDRTGPLHNESFSSYRRSVIPKPHRTTIRLAKEPNVSRISLCTSTVLDDLTGFLHEDCDDTVIELSKLSIGDAHEITVVENQDSSVRGTSARDFVLRLCKQSALLAFDECYPDSALKNCHKIGEGVYGEVFLWRARDGHARVLKVVPIAGTVKVNGEHQKDFDEIISEIVIAMELSALRAPIQDIESHFDEGKDADTLDLHTIENATDGFNEVIAVRCVQGGYPSRLLDLWELYDESKGSENDNPAALPLDQQYVVLELANAGQDLEGYQFNNAEQSHALLLQVAFTLAVGEEAFQFEHRDLHWGNVLIAPTEQKYATFVLRGRAHRVLRRGVASTVIDYSLSRLSLPLGGEPAALYNDLATDDGLFDAVGDRQFEVYRLMRDKLGNNWKNYEPYTNILWLHYTVDKMITSLRYKRTNTKLHKHFIAKLKGIKNRILNYRSAVEFVLTDNEF